METAIPGCSVPCLEGRWTSIDRENEGQLPQCWTGTSLCWSWMDRVRPEIVSKAIILNVFSAAITL